MEGQTSKDWINARGIARKYGLNYHNTRHFMVKLATNNYMEGRIVDGLINNPLDYRFIGDGFSRLYHEYDKIASGQL